MSLILGTQATISNSTCKMCLVLKKIAMILLYLWIISGLLYDFRSHPERSSNEGVTFASGVGQLPSYTKVSQLHISHLTQQHIGRCKKMITQRFSQIEEETGHSKILRFLLRFSNRLFFNKTQIVNQLQNGLYCPSRYQVPKTSITSNNVWVNDKK